MIQQTPTGKQQMMKGQQVRPVFRVDLSPLLKVAQAADPGRPPVAVEQEEIPSPGAAPAAPPSAGRVPTAGGAAPAAASPQSRVDSPEDAGQEDPEVERREARAKVLKLRDQVRQILEGEGLQFEINTSAEAVRVTVSIKPHVQAEDDQQWYPADQVMQPVVEKMFQLGFDVTEPTQAQAHRRYIDPKAKPVQYVFSYSAKSQQKEQQDGGYTVPRRPANGTPVPQRASSRMGVPAAKAAAASPQFREVIAEHKQELVATLAGIVAKTRSAAASQDGGVQ